MMLKNKVGIITGAARGIGQAYAVHFAEEGAKVVACDILDCSETQKQVEAKGGECLALKTDVTSEESTKKMAEETIKRFGRIDILVNNAAIYGGLSVKPFDATPVEEWDKVLAVNVKGLFLCCRAVVPQMKKQEKGKIINISSATFHLGFPHMIHYVTSKGAVVAFTRAMARELGEFGIYVNSVSPGYTMTEASFGLTGEGKDSDSFQRLANYITDHQCIKLREQPEDLCGPVAFLASDQSDFISGQDVSVDGGLAMH